MLNTRKMVKKLMLVMIFLIVIPMICATPTYKQNTVLDLKVPCINNGTSCSSSALCNTTIINPEGNLIVNNQEMSRNLSTFNYTLTPTQTFILGQYEFLVTCTDGTDSAASDLTFKITPSGFMENSFFLIVIVILSAGVIILGFRLADPPLVVLGSFGLYFLGIYILFNGILGVKDLITTWAIGLIVLGVAMYISIKSAWELINN